MYSCVHDTSSNDFDKRTKESIISLMSLFAFGFESLVQGWFFLA